MKIAYHIRSDGIVYASCSWDPKVRCAADDLTANPCAWAPVAFVTEDGQLVDWRGMADYTPCWAGGDAEHDTLQRMEPLRAGETYIMELDGPVAGIILRNAQFGAASFPGELPEPFAYAKFDGDDCDYNTIDEFSGGRTGGIKLFTEDQVRKLLATPAERVDDWRRLALQFDAHRMAALGHLRCLLENYAAHGPVVSKFLDAPPLDGEAVLAERIKALFDDAPRFTLTRRHQHGAYTDYEGTLVELPGDLVISMGLTLIGDDGAYLTFDVGSQHEAGDPVEYLISRAAADQILAACLEPK